MVKQIYISFLFALFLTISFGQEEFNLPSRLDPVIDYTSTLSSDEKEKINKKIRSFSEDVGSQIGVVIIPSTEGYPIEEVSMKIAEKWKLGRKGVDDGVLLLIAKNDRELRIEVGYGLEGAIPDIYAKRIINNKITPEFKEGDFYAGIDNGVENDAKAWIVRENDKRSKPTAYKEYPNPAAENITFHLGKGGNKVGSLGFKKASKKTKEILIDDHAISGIDLAKATDSKNRLLYVTPILKEDVHISGLASISVKIASSKPATNLSVWLVSLPWDEGRVRITNNVITRGWADLQNNKSLRKSKPLKPGKFYKMTFDLQPDDQIIRKGQQIGLMIFSSDNQFTLLPKPGTELTVNLQGTSITIPVVGGKEAFKKAID